MTVWRATSDGALTLGAERALVDGWLPAGAVEGARGRAHLLVESRPLGVIPPRAPSTLSLLDVGAWIDGDGVILRSADGRFDGVLELGGPGGTLGVTPGGHAEPLFTIAMALLLGRLGRALVHAAGVVAPDGRVWLLVGDTHAGKSTTTATLVRAGWEWLADDQVIVREERGELRVEGWARTPNLDAGYGAGELTGRRAPGAIVRAAVRGEFPFGGVLLPRVEGEVPTNFRPASASDTFTALVRQSPWLLADAVASAPVHRLLTAAASRPAVELTLGRDSYGKPEVLGAVLERAIQLR